jgi:hypothetical protein
VKSNNIPSIFSNSSHIYKTMIYYIMSLSSVSVHHYIYHSAYIYTYIYSMGSVPFHRYPFLEVEAISLVN